MTNEIATAGPAWFPGTMPVSTKMPVPMITPTPKTVRSRPDRFFLSRCSGSSVSLMESSTDFTRRVLTATTPPTSRQIRTPRAWHGCRPSACLRCAVEPLGRGSADARHGGPPRCAPRAADGAPVDPAATRGPAAHDAVPAGRRGAGRRLRRLRRRTPGAPGRAVRGAADGHGEGGLRLARPLRADRGGAGRDRRALPAAPAGRGGRRLRPPATQAGALRRRPVHGADHRPVRGARPADRDVVVALQLGSLVGVD